MVCLNHQWFYELLFLARGSMSFLTRRKISSIASAILFNCSVSILYPFVVTYYIWQLWQNYGNSCQEAIWRATKCRRCLGLEAWGLRLFFIIPDSWSIAHQPVLFLTSPMDQYQWTRLSYSLGIILVSPIFYLPYWSQIQLSGRIVFDRHRARPSGSGITGPIYFR